MLNSFLRCSFCANYCIFVIMKLDYYLPSNPSQSLVIQYEHVQAEGENISVIDRHIPSGYASLVFNSSGRAAIHEEPLIHLPRHFMVVPLFRAVNIGIYEDLDSFIITCKASVLSKLLSLNLSSFKSDFYRRSENDGLKTIEQKFIDKKSATDRIAIIEQFFHEKGLSDYVPDEIDTLYNLIMEGRGCVPIAQQVEQFDQSPRYFRQHFIERVGINAKTLARVVRVNYLWSMIMKNSAIDFQDMIFEGGYFDQAHLIHDFKKIVGEAPSYFFKRNLDNVEIISGKR